MMLQELQEDRLCAETSTNVQRLFAMGSLLTILPRGFCVVAAVVSDHPVIAL
jgi:hypothetical protein